MTSPSQVRDEAAKISQVYAELMRRQATLVMGNPEGPQDAKFMAASRAGEDIAGQIAAMPLPPDPPQSTTEKVMAVAKALWNSHEYAEYRCDWDEMAANEALRAKEVVVAYCERASEAIASLGDDPSQLPDGLMEDLARALEDAKVYVAIDCDGGSELRIRFEGPYSPERVHRARNADAALTAWRARKGEAT